MEILRKHSTWIQIKIQKLFIYFVTGIICGFVISMYKLGIHKMSDIMTKILKYCSKSYLGYLIFLILFVLIATLIYFMNNFDSMIKGSGIPSIYGLIDEKIKFNWKKTLPCKFIASVITVGSGLTLGREGPSVQIGGLVGQAVHSLTKGQKEDKKYFIGSSAGAGLAVAFNAPITGMLFAIEEIYKKTNRKVFLSSAITVFSAILCSDLILGNKPTLHNIPKIAPLGLNIYIYLIILGLLSGLSGALFNTMIISSKTLYKKIKVHSYIKFLFPFVITAIILLIDSRLFGAGEHLFYLALNENASIATLAFFYISKFFLLFIVFGADVPGGSLVPLLVLGSLLGNLYASILYHFGIIDVNLIFVFSMIGMCGHFSAIVRSPITAIILVLEMTGGSFDYLLAIAIVSLIAYVLAEGLGIKSFYEDLYDRMLEGLNKGKQEVDIKNN